MYRTGKPFHGSARLFLYLVIHVLSTTFLLDVEGAQVSSSQSQIEEAQKTVGRFLRNGVGTTWLSDLAKTRSTPLTTEDIVNELIRTTKPKGRVWRAASVLSEALKLQTLEGLRPASIIGQSDNWKDIIAGVEKEDDIICLYRKNTEETSKKSEDWQKFLKMVSPGYTVHLAIDTGLKYVICLKRIDVPEVTTTELSNATETTLSAGTNASVTEATSATSTLSTTTIAAKPAVIPTSAMKTRSTSEKSDFKSEEDHKCCDHDELQETEDNERTMKEAEKDIDKENLRDAEKDIDKENLRDAEKDIDKENLRDAEKDIDKENLRDAEKDIDKENLRDAEKDIDKENLRDAEKDIDKENLRDAEKDIDKENLRDAEKDIDKENLRDAEEDIDDDNSKDAEEDIDNEGLKDVEENYSIDNSFEDEHMEEMEEMKDDLSRESEDYRGSSEKGRPGPIVPPTGLRRFNSMNSVQPSYPSISASAGPGGFIPGSSKRDPQCGRPIILVVQPGNFPLGNFPMGSFPMGNFPMGNFPPPPLRLPVHRSPVPPVLTSIPRTPAMVPGWPRFNPLRPTNNYPRSMRTNNLGKPRQGFSTFMYDRLPLQNFSRNPNFGYKLPGEEMRLGKSAEKPIFQKNQNFDPKVLHRGSWGSRVVQRRPGVMMPRRPERLPVANIRNKALPIGRPSGLPQWPQEAKDIVIPRARVPNRSDIVKLHFSPRSEQERKKYLLRQLMINRLNSLSVYKSTPRVPIYKPTFNSALSRPIQPYVVQFPRPWILTRYPVQESPKFNRALPVPLPVQPVQNIDGMNPRLVNVLYHPPVNNFVKTRQSQSRTNAFTPVIQRPPIFEGIRFHGPCVKDPVDQLQRYPAACPSPCHRPIRLQIVIQEPSKVSVLTEPGERVEIFGSGNPAMLHRSRSNTSGRHVRGESRKAEEKIEPEVAEVERRMENGAKEETEKDKENEDEPFAIDDTSEGDESESEENSMTASSGNKTTSDIVEEDNAAQIIGERFLDETTIETTSSLEANSTMSAITNSTLIV